MGVYWNLRILHHQSSLWRLSNVFQWSVLTRSNCENRNRRPSVIDGLEFVFAHEVLRHKWFRSCSIHLQNYCVVVPFIWFFRYVAHSRHPPSSVLHSPLHLLLLLWEFLFPALFRMTNDIAKFTFVICCMTFFMWSVVNFPTAQRKHSCLLTLSTVNTGSLFIATFKLPTTLFPWTFVSWRRKPNTAGLLDGHWRALRITSLGPFFVHIQNEHIMLQRLGDFG